MSIDLKGKAARSSRGEKLSLPVWDWGPLASYVWEVAPQLVAKSRNLNGDPPPESYQRYMAGQDTDGVGGGTLSGAKAYGWHTNDGFGLVDDDARALADLLQGELSANRTLIYEKKRAGELELRPDIPCELCGGSGEREVTPLMASFRPDREVGTVIRCGSCEGRGVRRPRDCGYRFEMETVREFITFLRDCGGFEIW